MTTTGTQSGLDQPLPDQPVGGRFVSGEHRFPVRVYFEDTDMAGVVYHANYLRYMERARSDMLRVLGIDQRAHAEGGGGTYAITELTIRYRAPARLDDALLVVTRVTGIRPAALAVHHRVRRGDQLIAEAEGVAALVSPAGRPRRQPAAWLAIYQDLLRQGDTHRS